MQVNVMQKPDQSNIFYVKLYNFLLKILSGKNS